MPEPVGEKIGYRFALFQYLTVAGYDFEFVGSLSGGSASGYSFDYDHEGHGGWNAGQIADNVIGFLNSNPADVVLLHIGTNGITENPNEVERILDNIDSYSEDITVILALIINQQTYNPTVTTFNDNVESMAQARILDGDDIIIVDMESALIYPT